MTYQAEKHFTADEVELLQRVFLQQRTFGSFSIQYADGLSVTARLELVLRPPLPRWVRLLASAPTESLGVRGT